jgi:hypothetical protein
MNHKPRWLIGVFAHANQPKDTTVSKEKTPLRETASVFSVYCGYNTALRHAVHCLTLKTISVLTFAKCNGVKIHDEKLCRASAGLRMHVG